MDDERDEQDSQRPRPRVVDKRVTAGGTQEPRPVETPPEAGREPTEPAAGPPGAEPSDARPQTTESTEAGAAGERVWTPEQEAEARRMAEEMARIPALDWVANAAVTLVNVAASKIDRGALDEARLAIDALAAVVSGLGDRLGDVHAPLRQTLAQLQTAYAERAGKPPTP